MDKPITTVLFDLDGTLLDTAPTFAWIMNEKMTRQPSKKVAPQALRYQVANGALAMLRYAYPELSADTEFSSLVDEFLHHYHDNLLHLTQPLPGIVDLLQYLETRYRWAIVSNKSELFTKKLAAHYGWQQRAGCIVGGDTTAEKKPSALPLLHACNCLDSPPAECIYVGDAEKDIIAGKKAGMRTVIAHFGYMAATSDYSKWQADAIIEHAAQLPECLLSLARSQQFPP